MVAVVDSHGAVVTPKVLSRSRSRSLRRRSAAEAPGHGALSVSKLRASLQNFAESNGECLPPCFLDIYGDAGHASAHRSVQVLERACEAFFEAYGEQNVFIVRSPARINLRGMHIDNNGGYTNSILLDREVFIIFTVSPSGDLKPGICLQNIDDAFQPKRVTMPPKVTEEVINGSQGWSKYVAATVLALEQVAGIDAHSANLSGVVASTCPAGVGLSSSHAFVTCMLNALLLATRKENAIDQTSELCTAQRAEHLTGIKSGLMDQGSMIFGQRGSLLHGRFYDRKVHEIVTTVRHCPWPKDCAVVVANSKVVRQLAKGGNAAAYGLPRLGCAIAMPVLCCEAARRGLSSEDMLSWGVGATLSLLKSVPAAAPLSQLLDLFKEHKTEIEAAVERFIPGGAAGLGDMPIPLRGSTLFTLAESARGKEFFAALQRGDIAACGKLMDIGHEGDAPEGELHISDADLDALAEEHAGSGLGSLSLIPGTFRAGHPRLDELCHAMRSLGAAGASLTGAGHGGCAVGLFASHEQAKQAVAGLLRDFPDLGQNDVFVTFPIQGRGLLNLACLL